MCRAGCPTQNHKSYSECCKGLQINAQGMLGTKAQKDLDNSLKAYRGARREGIQPDGTSMAQVEKAKKMSDASGVAYGA